MNVELRKFKFKHIFRFFFGIMNFKILKDAGFFDKKFFKRVTKRFFSKRKLTVYNYVVVVDNKMVGGIQLGRFSNDNWYVGGLIFKKYWKRGFATKVGKKIFILAKKKGIKKLKAEVFHQNIISMKLMKKFDFKKIGEDKKDTFWEKKLK